MHIGIVYDSVFGNTGQIAAAIEAALQTDHSVRCVKVQDASKLDLGGLDLLILGSPTRGFTPTPLMRDYADSLGSAPKSMQVAVFDTCIDLSTVRRAPLRWVMDAGGYAASRLAGYARRQGLALRGEPGGFLVTGTNGPLKEGTLEQATRWAKSLLTQPMN